MTIQNKAIFIDKDGTLIPDIPYNITPHLITLKPEAVTGLQALKKQGYLLIVISNQSGVARGYFKEEDLKGVQQKIVVLLNEHHIVLDGFYYCPHYPNAAIEKYAVACDCRKPQPGMLLKAAADFNIDLTQSWMIGDILNDIEAGNKAGCHTVLVDNGGETEWIINESRTPTYIVNTINDAAEKILSH
jgi:D-glycero-D-manno-heptose 1,7-bisphosphate phosphatase